MLGETSPTWFFHSQCFVAEIGRFWWVKLVQLAVKDIEAVEAHLGLHDRRITYTRTVRQYRCAVAWCTRGVVVQLLLFRTATAGSHISLLQLAVVVVDYYTTRITDSNCGRELRTRTVYDPRTRLTLVLSSSRLAARRPSRPPPPPSSSVPCCARAPPDDATRVKTAVSSPAISSRSFPSVPLSIQTTTSKLLLNVFFMIFMIMRQRFLRDKKRYSITNYFYEKAENFVNGTSFFTRNVFCMQISLFVNWCHT